MSGGNGWASEAQAPDSRDSPTPHAVPELASQTPSLFGGHGESRFRRILRQVSSRPLRVVVVLAALLTAIATPQALGLGRGSVEAQQVSHRHFSHPTIFIPKNYPLHDLNCSADDVAFDHDSDSDAQSTRNGEGRGGVF